MIQRDNYVIRLDDDNNRVIELAGWWHKLLGLYVCNTIG